MAKLSWQRPHNKKRFDTNFDKIFRKDKMEEETKLICRVCEPYEPCCRLKVDQNLSELPEYCPFDRDDADWRYETEEDKEG